MADILAFVRNTQRSTPAGSAAESRCEVLLFPGASVELLQALMEPEDAARLARTQGRSDH